MRNKSAFGTCTNCQANEHFSCAGTPPQMKEDIKQRLARFLCTNCFESNPLLGKQMLAIEDEQSNVKASGVDLIESDDEDTEAVTLVESAIGHSEASRIIESESGVDKKLISCDGCSFVTNEGEELRLHIQETHTPTTLAIGRSDEMTEANTNVSFKFSVLFINVA